MTLQYYNRFINWFEKYLVLVVVGSFILGILGGRYSQDLVDQVNSAVELLMNTYQHIAPLAIFFVLAPSLNRMVSSKTMGRFGLVIIRWFALRKIMAAVWAVIFIAIVFQLPLLPQQSISLSEALSQTLKSLGHLALISPYFWAMYAALVVAFVATKTQWIQRPLEKILDGVERAGIYLMPVIPMFMFGIGAYIYGLPQHVAEQIGLAEGSQSTLASINIWSWQISSNSPFGMLIIYVLGALLTATACFIWQLVFLVTTRRYEPRLTIKKYFTDYWVKVYPLLWATSSEALATPLNLYLTKKHLPWVRPEIRRLVVGGGSYMGINGTIINVFVLGVMVILMLGLQVSIFELLMIIPVVFLISYGVPGIPGELVLFAGPIAILLGIPESITPIFLAIYLGLQIGLSDSFRTGNNSTDNYIGAVLMNAIYEKRFMKEQKKECTAVA